MKKNKKSEAIKAEATIDTTFKPSKESKLFQNLLKTVEQYMAGKSYAGLNEYELIQKLSIPEMHRDLFKAVLTKLLESDFAILKGERYFVNEAPVNVVKGFLHMHPRGFGFLQAEDSALHPQDIFIPKHLTQNAVHGDIVEVEINYAVVSEKGPEGRVVAILERARTHMGGIIKSVDKNGTILAFAPMLGAQQRVVVNPSEDFKLKVGDRVVMEVKEWGSKDTETLAQVSHFIGHISDPSCDIKAAIEEFEIRADFPVKVLTEASSFGTVVSQKDIATREDFRNVTSLTIDPDTAKDFDDAISLSKENGIYHLAVHIADVSHYVAQGTALDKEASERCNSTYFPGVCIPMLPPELSNNLCSLKPNVNRLTVSVIMEFDSDGNLLKHRMAKTVIKSAKRFTYKEAKLVLDGKKKSKHADQLQLMAELCGHLKKKRYERGSIEFAIPELVVIVDENGVPYKTDYIEYDITHQLVEEFMLKANEMVATHLTRLEKSLTYRVHDIPAEENLKDFSTLAIAFGFKLSEIPTSQELQKLFEEAKSTSYGEYLATSYIRKMRLAIYSADNIGHYGLGLDYYCHFTSPIRRYVDLVVHRILFSQQLSHEKIATIAEKCSDQERISAKAEGSVVLLKKLRLLQTHFEKEPQRQYEAVVTKIKNFGVYFEVLELMLESFLHISELENDYYVYDDKKQQLMGKRTGSTFFSGDKMTVMLSEINLITRESKWSLVAAKKEIPYWAEEEDDEPRKGPRAGPRKGQRTESRTEPRSEQKAKPRKDQKTKSRKGPTTKPRSEKLGPEIKKESIIGKMGSQVDKKLVKKTAPKNKKSLKKRKPDVT